MCVCVCARGHACVRWWGWRWFPSRVRTQDREKISKFHSSPYLSGTGKLVSPPSAINYSRANHEGRYPWVISGMLSPVLLEG